MDRRDFEIFDSTLRYIQNELISDRLNNRNKALQQLEDYLGRRSDEIHALVKSTIYKSEATWESLFTSVLSGMKQHAEKMKSSTVTTTLENKGRLFKQVLSRLVSEANERIMHIPKHIIFERIFEVLKDDQDMVTFFGAALITIIDEHVVVHKFTQIKCSMYKQYLSFLFTSLFAKSIPDDTLIECLSNAIEAGMQYLDIGPAFESYMEGMSSKIENESNDTAKMTLLKIAYFIGLGSVATRRERTGQFLLALTDVISTFYSVTRIRDEDRSYIIKILDLVVLVQTVTDVPALPQDKKALRTSTYIVEQEIERMSGRGGRFQIDSIFIDFAVRVCALTLWDESIWETASGSQQHQPQKRMKYMGKFQALVSRTEATSSNYRVNRKYNSHWMLILAKIMEMHPERITDDDYEDILKLLTEFQPQILKPEQFHGFYIACKVLLNRGDVSQEPGINQQKVADHWHKIVETAARSCSNNSQNSKENLMLIRLILKYKQHKGDTFVESILDTYFTNSINRSNESLQTLITLLLTYNINVLKNPSEKIEKILSYLLLKPKFNTITSILRAEGKPDAYIVARLVVICNMYKSTIKESVKEKWLDEAINYRKDVWVTEEYTRYTKLMKSIKDTILIQLLQKPIFDDPEIIQTVAELKSIPSSQESLCAIDDKSFVSFCSKIMPIESQMACSQTSDNHDDVLGLMQEKLYNCSILVHTFNYFIEIRAIHLEKVDDFQLAKRIKIIVPTLEKDFATLDGNEGVQEKIEMMKHLNEIFETSYHKDVLRIARDSNWTNCFSWIAKVVRVKYDKDEMEPNIYMSLKQLPLKILAAYILTEGKETTRVEALLQKCIRPDANVINVMDVDDVLVYFESLSLFLLSTRASHQISNEMFQLTYEILSNHFANSKVIEKFIPMIPKFLKYYLKSNMEEEKRTHASSIFQDLLKAAKSFYPSHVTVEIIRLIKHYVYENSSLDKFDSLCKQIYQFTNSSCIGTRIAAIQAFIYVIYPTWSNITDQSALQEIDKLFQDIYEDNQEDFEAMLEPDIKSSKISIATQLYCTTLCVNYQLRHKSIIGFLDMCYLCELPTEIMRTFLNQLNNVFNCNIFQIFQDDMKRCLSYWVSKDYPFPKFPYYVTGAASLDDFLTVNTKLMSVAVLTSNEEMIAKLCKSTNKTEDQLIIEVMPDLMLEILPSLTLPKENVLPGKIEKANKLIEKIRKLPNHLKLLNECLNRILELLIQRFFDNEFIKKYLNTSVTPANDAADSLSHQHLINCYEYLKQHVQRDTSQSSILVTICEKTPFYIQSLLLTIEMRLASVVSHEQKLICLSQYIWIFEHIKIFIAQSTNVTPKLFFIMNMVHTMCDQINSGIDIISKAAFFYFKRICEEFIGIGPNSLTSRLTFIVHSLVQNIMTTSNSEVVTFLEHLLINNAETFSSAIILLPDFPTKPEFKQLQESIVTARNKMQQNTLKSQIKQFFNIQYLTVETLKSLHTSLSTRKSELVEMYQKAKKIQFSDEANKSQLHRLVTKLISIVEGLDKEKAYEASRCLGEFGAANLTTLALYDQSESSCYTLVESNEEALRMVHQELFVCLKDAIFDSNIKLKCVANNVAFKLMQSEIGHTFKESYPMFESYLVYKEPVLPSLLNCSNIVTTHLSNIFVQTRGEDYKTWIKNVCIRLLKVFNDDAIIYLVNLMPDFAESLLPVLLKVCLTTDINNEILSDLNKEIQLFFNEFYMTMKNESVKCNFYHNKFIVKTMLMVFECCRVQFSKCGVSRMNQDYLHLIKAADYCNASFSCILYSQLWSSAEASKHKTSSIFYDVKTNDEVCGPLRSAYGAVGNLDAEYHLVDPLKDHHYLLAYRPWQEAFLDYPRFDWDKKYQEVLTENGLYEFANEFGKPGQPNYEIAWRLSEWSLFDENEYKDDLNLVFEKSHYEALKCLHLNDKTGIKRNVRQARIAVVEIIKNTATECPKNLYKCLNLLELLQQIDDVTVVRFDKVDPEILISKWNTNDLLPQTEFKLTELKLTQRAVALQETGVVAKRNWLPKILPKTMLNVISEAINNNHDNLAFRKIASMGSLGSEIDLSFHYKLKLKRAILKWKHNDLKLATELLDELKHAKDAPAFVKIEVRFLLGHNLTSSVMDPIEIYKKHFQVAHRLTIAYAKNENKLEQLRQGVYDNDDVGQDLRALSQNFVKIAKFFDKHYVDQNNYLLSRECMMRKSVIERQEFSLQVLKEKQDNGELSKEERSQIRTLTVNCKADRQKLEKHTEDRDTYLAYALRYYGYACRYSDTESLHVFRIVHLFLSHKSIQAVRKVIVGEMDIGVPEENDMKSRFFDTLPSYMFLNILPQLSAHLCNDTDRTYVDDEIYKLLKRCAIEHPHHTLNHLMAMSNSYADESNTSVDQEMDSRVQEARHLLNEIRNVNPSLKKSVDQLTTMTTVLIELANKKMRDRPGSCELNQSSKMMKLKDLTAVHCPTVNLPIMKNGGYEHVIVTIQKWNRTVEVLNGINAPKKFECICSDGVKRIQLLKGNDDLRQDAVMQQVFNIMNTMLAQNPKASERRLQIRTYKVIPFSRRSGMLEWCDNTIPIGHVLLEVHRKFRPFDNMTPQKAREAMAAASPSSKLKVYQNICKDMKPAFHHFFLSNFYTPGSLYEHQYTYTNSVATNSIIGYILGIGDRHVQNILLDYKTTEVVHIDFGIAFDQGKCLPTPETIPFRLTRDIVAGMGVTGYEGVFRKSAEITMQVLRENQHTILAILQVLLYDPLYMWTLTPEKARRTQSMEYDPEVPSNTSAERALEVCKEKLNGAENGSYGVSSIEDQVNKLIQDATAVEYLSRLFQGWQPYL